MDEQLFQLSDLEILRREGKYFARYDAGSHQVVMREDEISEQEATFASQGQEAAIKMLFALQKRLAEKGIDPYVSNV